MYSVRGLLPGEVLLLCACDSGFCMRREKNIINTKTNQTTIIFWVLNRGHVSYHINVKHIKRCGLEKLALSLRLSKLKMVVHRVSESKMVKVLMEQKHVMNPTRLWG